VKRKILFEKLVYETNCGRPMQRGIKRIIGRNVGEILERDEKSC